MQFLTGMWACDLQGSSDLENAQKKEFNDVIEKKCGALLQKYDIKILCNQFRGDGRLIVFEAENMQSNLFTFAKSFCEEINRDKEEGRLSQFYIRTYIHIGSIQIDGKGEGAKAIGKDVDEFCGLVDNKQNGRIQVKENCSSVLIVTSQCYRFLNDIAKQKLSKYVTGDKEYYICEFQPKNLVICLVNSNERYYGEIQAAIHDEFEKQKVKVVNMDRKSNYIVVISNSEEREKVYNGLKNALEIISKKANRNKWEGKSIVLIDIEKTDNHVPLEALQDKLNFKDVAFSNYLIWSDVSLDEFKKDSYFENEDKVLTKYAMSENMRLYAYDFSEKIIRKNNVTFFSKLDERCVYLHSFDYGGIKLIKELNRINLEQYLCQQLEMGLILSDGVIIHSAEAFRSEEVYNVLKKYEKLIKDGSVKLLFSSKVNDVKLDFQNYIDEKIGEYSISQYGTIEVESLKKAKEVDGRIEKTMKLLSLCPYMIKRDGDGTGNLEELLKRDLNPNYVDLILRKEDYSSVDLMKCNYSLFQLLNARYVENNNAFRILSEEIKQDIVEKIEELVNGVISASIVNCVFEEKIPNNLKRGIFKKWYSALLHRANFLYAKINTGKFLYVEYLPNLCKGSLFDYSKFFGIFQDCVNADGIGSDRIMKIRNSGEKWEKFKLYYYNAQLLSQSISIYGFEGSKLYDTLIRKAQEQLKVILE